MKVIKMFFSILFFNMIICPAMSLPKGITLRQWENRKDWTYYSRRSCPVTVGAYSLSFFESISGGFATDNIPAAGAFPASFKFFLARIGLMIMPQLNGTLATSTLFQMINTYIQNSIFRLRVMNEVYFEKPFSSFLPALSLAPDSTAKMASGNINTIGSCILNKGILFERGTNFNFTMETVTTADTSTLISKIEAKMDGFLLEAE